MGGGGFRDKDLCAQTGGGTGQACCGVAGGRPTVPFTAHAFSVLVFFIGISGGGISGTGGAEHLAFLLVLGLMEGESVSGLTGTGRTITTGPAVFEGLGEARAFGLLLPVGDAVVETVSALTGDTNLSTQTQTT